ncbi:MAG: hypothetical protein UY81_C0063G0009 [Candidatus Giovannonibacteria bacterium GW2011_GWA2_53_7]|uniref:Uncharacterized protein n=1 Tax=Candidatus Giovannonibacteria bacterium GW2011_GWA2_53_7 TaxID=1618650 RepID=A0A0G1XUZ8_9BACT|nr:MAG: hypothetical protein UY81_C0063G0009 [Candidatus Giovannonibacteria bacterium GW2011_GWA2_53_7]
MNKQRGGFIKLLLIIIVAAIILGYYRVDIKNIVGSDLVQRNLNYLWGIAREWGGWIWAKLVPVIDNLR